VKLANKAQQEQLQEITQYLRQVRQDRSIRIEEIAARTNIQITVLKALDAGKFEELPEPVYVQGFIRRYGDAVGLDGATLANTFTINDFPQYATYNNSQNLDRKTTTYIPNFVPYVLLLALAAVGGIYVLNPKVITEFIAKKQNSVTTQAATTAPVTSTDEPLAQIQNSVSTSETTPLLIAPPQKPANTNNLEVSLELQGKSWLQVTVDDKTEFMGNLNKGAQRTWTAKEKLTVRSGNAGAVLISVNQQPAKPFGDDGDIKEVTFTTETYAQQ
jgi:cytoskeletal protein RodZ